MFLYTSKSLETLEKLGYVVAKLEIFSRHNWFANAFICIASKQIYRLYTRIIHHTFKNKYRTNDFSVIML